MSDTNMNSVELLPGGITGEQLQKWKNQYGENGVIQVDVNKGEIITCYIRKPDRNVYARAITLFQQDKLLECGEAILNNCWLGGDIRCKDDEMISISTAMACKDAIYFYPAVLKNV